MPYDMEKYRPIDSPDDPERCHGVTKGGQCHYKHDEGSVYCSRHGAGVASTAKKTEARRYMAEAWNARISKLADEEGIRSLRDEIAVLRMLLDSILRKCKTDADLYMEQPKISDLVTRIERIVVSFHKLEKSSGMLLDKAAAIQMAGSIVTIVSELVPDVNVVEQIADRILTTVNELQIDEDE